MENLQKKEKNYERHDVEGTPFTIMKETKTKSCQITIGNNLMVKKTFTTMTAAKKYIEGKPWELIMNTMALMCMNITNDLLTTKTQEND